jgi:hypothetical protein
VAIPINERLLVAIARSKAAIPDSANSGQIQPVRSAPMVAVQPIGVDSQQRTLLWQAARAAVGGFATVRFRVGIHDKRTFGLRPELAESDRYAARPEAGRSGSKLRSGSPLEPTRSVACRKQARCRKCARSRHIRLSCHMAHALSSSTKIGYSSGWQDHPTSFDRGCSRPENSQTLKFPAAVAVLLVSYTCQCSKPQ